MCGFCVCECDPQALLVSMKLCGSKGLGEPCVLMGVQGDFFVILASLTRDMATFKLMDTRHICHLLRGAEAVKESIVCCVCALYLW